MMLPIKDVFDQEDLDNFKKISEFLGLEFDEYWTVNYMCSVILLAFLLTLFGNVFIYTVLSLILIHIVHIEFGFWTTFFIVLSIDVLSNILEKIYLSIIGRN